MSIRLLAIIYLFFTIIANIAICQSDFLGEKIPKDEIPRKDERMLQASTDNIDPGNPNCGWIEVCQTIYFPNIGYREICRTEYICE